MKNSDKFALLVELDPEAAMSLQPDVRFQVSKRTLAQVAATKFGTLKISSQATSASTDPRINNEQAQELLSAAMAATIRSSEG